MTTIEMKQAPVTLYYRGGLGSIVKVEARSFGHTLRRYAQYPSAIAYRYVPKGKRAPRSGGQDYAPSLLVLEGHGHPDPDDAYLPAVKGSDGATSARGRYTSCDPRWQSDFDAKIDAYLASSGVKVVCDFRKHDPMAPAAEKGGVHLTLDDAGPS